jgi:hypothetical protein
MIILELTILAIYMITILQNPMVGIERGARVSSEKEGDCCLFNLLIMDFLLLSLAKTLA